VGLLLSLSRAGPVQPDFPVVVSTYEIVMADIKALGRYHWKYLVVDEGHRLKNFNCRLIRDLKTLTVDNKLLLTGGLVKHLVIVRLNTT
jgi:ATP-dependent DNA helicase